MRTDSPDSPIVAAVVDEFQKIKKLADKAVAQLSDAQLHVKIDSEANSVAIIMRHAAGNMRSRWVNFLTSDGEKPDRMRDREFDDVNQTRAELMAEWEHGWQCLFDAITPLSDADLQRTVMIRSEPLSVYQAMSRQVAHYAGHAYQILLLAKHVLGPNWKTLSIPRGQSEEFNRKMLAKLKGTKVGTNL